MTARPIRLLALAVLALVLVVSGCVSQQQSLVQDHLNWSRGSHGLTLLPTHVALNVKAQAWADNLARRGSLAHSELSDGLPPCWQAAGENVGYGPSIVAVQDAYMASPPHRANILNTSWDFVGVGHATADGRVYTVQVFMDGCA